MFCNLTPPNGGTRRNAVQWAALVVQNSSSSIPKPEELKLELRSCRDKAGLWGGGKDCSLEGTWVALGPYPAGQGMSSLSFAKRLQETKVLVQGRYASSSHLYHVAVRSSRARGRGWQFNEVYCKISWEIST